MLQGRLCNSAFSHVQFNTLILLYREQYTVLLVLSRVPRNGEMGAVMSDDDYLLYRCTYNVKTLAMHWSGTCPRWETTSANRGTGRLSAGTITEPLFGNHPSYGIRPCPLNWRAALVAPPSFLCSSAECAVRRRSAADGSPWGAVDWWGRT